MTRKLAPIILVSVLLGLSGCDAFRAMTGAPSREEVAAVQTRIAEQDKAIADLDAQRADAQRQASALESKAGEAEARKASVRALYGRMAQELANTSGPEADALVQSLGNLQAQLVAIEAGRSETVELAARWKAEEAAIAAAQNRAQAELADAEAQLEGFHDATQAAVAGVTKSVGIVAKAAEALGIPGASAVAGQITGGLNVLLPGALGLTTLGGAVAARRRKREAREAQTKASNLAKVVTATEKFGLLKDDAEARLGAKEWAGPEAHKALKLALVENGAA